MRVSNFGGELIGRTEMEMRVKRLRNRKAVGKDEANGEKTE